MLARLDPRYSSDGSWVGEEGDGEKGGREVGKDTTAPSLFSGAVLPFKYCYILC